MILRCRGNKIHGEILGDAYGILEKYCDSRFCGKKPGVVVVHRFDLSTGELSTRQFKQPQKPQLEVSNAT